MHVVRPSLIVALLIGLAGCGSGDGPLVRSTGAPLHDQVPICHVPPGDPANVHLITVDASAVPAHLANHGDGMCADGNSDCCPPAAGPAVCTNLQTDGKNCGTCGNVCPSGQTCSNGKCVGGGCIPSVPPGSNAVTCLCGLIGGGVAKISACTSGACATICDAVCGSCNAQYGGVCTDNGPCP